MPRKDDEPIRSYDGVRSIREHVEEELNSEDIYKNLSDLRYERSLRETDKRDPSMARWDVDQSDSIDYPFRPPEGSVTLFFAERESEIIEDLEYAILTHDLDELDEIGDRAAEEVGSRSIRSVRSAVGEATDAPVLFDLRYDGYELARNLFLSDMELGAVTFPYNGAELEGDRFDIVEHTAEGADPDPYDYLVVTAKPELSDLEKRVVDTIPRDNVDMKVGGVGPVGILPTVAAALGTAAAIAATVAAVKSTGSFHDQLANVSVSDRYVRQMGVRSSASELLEARREVFEEHML